jgi:hypothetical protein
VLALGELPFPLGPTGAPLRGLGTGDADDIWKFLGVLLAQTGLYIHSLEAKLHGRMAMTLKGAEGYGCDRIVDLSVIPPARPPT